MAISAANVDDRRAIDATTEEAPMGSLQLSEVEMASWGASWQPDAPADRLWPDIEPHPPDEERWASSEAGDGRPSFERRDAYGEDVLRLRRFIVGN